jgi:hypothetical protein
MYGNLINRIMETSRHPEPEVGMGATVCMWSDRHAVTISEVVRYKSGPKAGQVKAVKTRADRSIRTDSNGMSDAQAYRYEPIPDAPEATWTLRKDGSFRKQGSNYTSLVIGSRDTYHDYSF